MKILFYCSFPTQSNGYARIGNNITNFLSNYSNIEIYYFGITHNKELSVERFIHPKIKIINVIEESPSKNAYGDDLILSKISEIQPDIVFLYNDILVLSRMINQINQIPTPRPFKVFTYIDLVYEFENPELIHFINQSTDKFFVFANCWKTHLEKDYSISPEKVFVLNHGLDVNRVFPIQKETARRFFQFDPKDFVILNLNRNTHRKAIDITIRAFLNLLHKYPDHKNLKLFLNGISEPSSYPNITIIEMECKRLGLDFNFISNHQILVNKNTISDYELNYLYNAADVGINTCFGEGFGLCCLEHGSVGSPQVVSAVGALKDIFQDDHCILVEPSVKIFAPTLLENTGGYFEIGKVEDFTKALEIYYLDTEKRNKDGLWGKQNLPIKYDWNTILKEFYETHLTV
jgi:glycosyltransferase involved in cell wall biosynthesis